MLKKIGSFYVGMVVGVVFGSIVATLTTYYILDNDDGLEDTKVMTILGIQDCLQERINE